MTDKEWEKINEFVGKVVDFIEIVFYILLIPLIIFFCYIAAHTPSH